MAVHVTTLRVHRQCHYSRRTSHLSVELVHRRVQVVYGQAVLGRPVSRSGECTEIVLVTLPLPLQVVVGKEWSERHRKV
jgi:hypothetical protein